MNLRNYYLIIQNFANNIGVISDIWQIINLTCTHIIVLARNFVD